MRFRTREVEVDAVEHSGVTSDGAACFATYPPGWLLDAIAAETVTVRDGVVTVRCPDRDRQALPGDWLIHGAEGGIVPVASDLFASTFEAA